MPKPDLIELPSGEQIPILYEDRSVLAIDKPPGWILAPSSWQNTGRNLQSAIAASIAARDFWARSRNLKYLRFVHRLDAETSGVLLLAKSPGAIRTYSALFESRAIEKSYLAVVRGRPQKSEWCCRLKIAPDPAHRGRMKADSTRGKEAETRFRALDTNGETTLVLARPLTGRTHQIRVHLAATGHPVSGDVLYGPTRPSRPVVPGSANLALRAVFVGYTDPFTHRPVHIQAPVDDFLRQYGFAPESAAVVLAAARPVKSAP